MLEFPKLWGLLHVELYENRGMTGNTLYFTKSLIPCLAFNNIPGILRLLARVLAMYSALRRII